MRGKEPIEREIKQILAQGYANLSRRCWRVFRVVQLAHSWIKIQMKIPSTTRIENIYSRTFLLASFLTSKRGSTRCIPLKPRPVFDETFLDNIVPMSILFHLFFPARSWNQSHHWPSRTLTNIVINHFSSLLFYFCNNTTQTEMLNSNTFKCRKIVLMLEPVCDDHCQKHEWRTTRRT